MRRRGPVLLDGGTKGLLGWERRKAIFTEPSGQKKITGIALKHWVFHSKEVFLNLS